MVFTIDSRYFFPSGAFVGWTIHCLLDLARDVLDQSRTQRDDWLLVVVDARHHGFFRYRCGRSWIVFTMMVTLKSSTAERPKHNSIGLRRDETCAHRHSRPALDVSWAD
jgi:hypothetical protein